MRSLLLAIAVLPGLAAAQAPEEPPARTYGFASFGTVEAHGDLELMGFDSGSAFEVGAGFHLTRHVAVEGGIGYLAFSVRGSFTVRQADAPDAPIDELELARSLAAVPLVATVRLHARWGLFEAYGLAGAGLYFVTIDLSTRSSIYGPSSWSATDTCFGLQAGAGLAASISRAVAIGVEARYVAAKATFRYPGSETTRPAEWTTRLDSVVLSGTLAYRF